MVGCKVHRLATDGSIEMVEARFPGVRLIITPGSKKIMLEAMNTGHPIRDCRNLDHPRTVLCFRYFGGIADKLEGAVIPVDGGLRRYQF